MENPIKMDDLGVPLFLERPTWCWMLFLLSFFCFSLGFEMLGVIIMGLVWSGCYCALVLPFCFCFFCLLLGCF